MTKPVKYSFIILIAFVVAVAFYLSDLHASHSFYSGKKSSPKISVVEIKTGKIRDLTVGSLPKLLPFSDKIVFLSPQGLSIIDNDGKNEKLLIKKEKRSLQYFSISADGKKIILYKNDERPQLIITNTDGSGYKKIFDMSGIPFYPYPVLSPRSDKILFINGCDLAIIDTNGSNYKVIKASNKSCFYEFPRFLPDNNRIMFFEEVRDKKNNRIAKHLKVLSLNSGTETVIGKYNAVVGFEVSENGIILVKEFSGSYTTKIIDSNNNFKVIYSFRGSEDNSLSHDGKYIVSHCDGSINIRDIDGKNKKVILKDDPSFLNSYPQMTSDGKYIVCKSINKTPKQMTNL